MVDRREAQMTTVEGLAAELATAKKVMIVSVLTCVCVCVLVGRSSVCRRFVAVSVCACACVERERECVKDA